MRQGKVDLLSGRKPETEQFLAILESMIAANDTRCAVFLLEVAFGDMRVRGGRPFCLAPARRREAACLHLQAVGVLAGLLRALGGRRRPRPRAPGVADRAGADLHICPIVDLHLAN